MAKISIASAKLARDLILFTPRLFIKCPHCHDSLRGNELIPNEDPTGQYSSAQRGPLSPLQPGKTMSNIPSHAGLTEEDLKRSILQSRVPPLEDIYNTCVEIHNAGPRANKSMMVWGAGNPVTSKILFIGEAPGWQEEQTGMPFIGVAGQVLSSVMHSCGIHRVDDAFLINTTLYAPPRVGNKIGKPSSVTMLAERPRVMAVIQKLQAKSDPIRAIVCLGKYPFVQLTQEKRLIEAVKAKSEVNMSDIILKKHLGWWNRSMIDGVNVPVMITYHPSYIHRIIRSAKVKPTSIPAVREYKNTFDILRERINVSV